METKTFMAIGGHVGDMELTVGGVLSTLSLSGHRIVTVALTAGEKGNPPHLTTDEYRKQKIDEAAAFATMLGGISEVLPYDDGLLPVDDTVKFQVADLIRKYKPVRIFTHWQNSFHKDHKACNQIVKDAQFYAALPGFQRELPPHYAGGPYYAENWEDATDFQPYALYKIPREGFELWQKAIQTQWFAINSKDFKYYEYYCSLKAARGKLARSDYAEAFDLDPHHKTIVIDTQKL